MALGDLLLDVVVAPEGRIEKGSDVPGKLSFRRGGSAATTAAVFVRLGGSAALITSLGDDYWSGRLLASLRADGVRVHALREHGRSGRLAAIVDRRGERSFVTERGAADALRPADIKAGWLRGAAVFHVPAYSLFNEPIASASLTAAGMAHDAGAIVSTDVSSSGPLLSFGIGRARARFADLSPDVLFANRDEAAALVGRPDRRAWPDLLSVAPLVVVKDGVSGCCVLWRAGDDEAGEVRRVDVAARRVGAVDSTGAGDAFAAGFLFSLLGSGRAIDARRAQALRGAARAGHRAAADALRRERPELDLR
ncbi:MAG: carbohydrate kinase family protein [Chloroflexota bacterium]